MELFKISALDLAAQVSAREISAREVIETYLERIAALDPLLHAFLCLDAPRAIAQAQAVDTALGKGRSPLPLAGVPVGLKDIFVTQGMQTTCGSAILRGWIPSYNATVVESIQRAGGVILGKLNMDEFAMGSSNENSAFGPTRNPWDLTKVPGGSSGGSAAAMAADLCGLALGTDTGGSIRQPAAFCGVVGMKPTYGRVSRYGVIAYASSLDQVGPLSKNVCDCALMMQIIAGHDPQDSTSISAEAGDYLAACKRGVNGLRLGVPLEYFAAGLNSQVEKAVRQALKTLEDLGATLVEISLPHTKYAIAAYYLIATAEASSNLARYDGVRYGYRSADFQDLREMYAKTRCAGFGSEVKRRIMLGTFALSAGYYDAYYGKAQKVRTLVSQDFTEAFQHCDLIATPTSPCTAFAFGERLSDPLQMYLADIYTISCNLAGLPGLSLPCGFNDAGMPIGLQLLGPPLGEEQIFAAAAAYEGATDWHQRRPTLAVEQKSKLTAEQKSGLHQEAL